MINRYTLGVIATLSMLAGCGGQAGGGVVPTSATLSAFPYHKSFYYTGAVQSFKVPAGVRQLNVIARGAHGARASGDRKPAAFGGRVHAVIPVTPGETLAVYVGGDASGATGGFNGGANGGASGYGGGIGGGGGGATDLREGGTSLRDRIIVSGGAGGAGTYGPGTGGKGGGTTGGMGGCGQEGSTGSRCDGFGGSGGSGGTQSAGGQGGAGASCETDYGNQGENGALGIGGNGSAGGSSRRLPYPSGGGGGGYYGGGGGGSGCSFDSSGSGGGGGGGGGSSYAERKATSVRFWQGWRQSAHNGLVVFSWQ